MRLVLPALLGSSGAYAGGTLPGGHWVRRGGSGVLVEREQSQPQAATD
jgi:hypothetical protein